MEILLNMLLSTTIWSRFEFPDPCKRHRVEGECCSGVRIGAPRALDDRAQTPDVELQRLSVFVCPPLRNMWF